MKKRFYEGEEVVCLDKEMKSVRDQGKIAPDLVYNNLYTIVHYEEFRYGHWWVRVAETPYGSFYTEDTFAPITQIEELMEEVNEIVLENQIKRMYGIYRKNTSI